MYGKRRLFLGPSPERSPPPSTQQPIQRYIHRNRVISAGNFLPNGNDDVPLLMVQTNDLIVIYTILHSHPKDCESFRSSSSQHNFSTIRKVAVTPQTILPMEGLARVFFWTIFVYIHINVCAYVLI